MGKITSAFFSISLFAMCRSYFILLILLLFPKIIFAQLANFTLSLSKTDETCLGNGSITFTTAGTTSGSTITYYVYELPNTTTAIAIQTATTLGGRTSGTYQVTAVQVLGSEQNSQTETITINSVIVPLSYYVTSTNSVCNDGTMTAMITAGTGAQYEIISGPVIRPLQTSPLFTLLPAGVYQVRAYNNCGDATVVTHTLLSSATSMVINPVNFPDDELPNCNAINVSNTLNAGPGDALHYPLQITYVINFPNGSTQTINKTVTTGLITGEELVTQIPFFYDQTYSYDLTITDNCGNTYTSNNVVNKKLVALIAGKPSKCGGFFLSVGASVYTQNVLIQFTDFPVGFNPFSLNAEHPGPFGSIPTEYGTFLSPVPFGHYAVLISDGCGHTAVGEVTLVDEPVQPTHEAIPLPGCLSNKSKVTITIPRYEVQSAVITIAPTAYGLVPDDVSDLINSDGELVLLNLITGDYTIILTDKCGVVYTYEFSVQDLNTTISYAAREGCEIGKGSIRIRGNDTQLTSVIMTAAPTTFPNTLPFNANSYISTDGNFSMGNLLPGNYSFDVIDSCGITHTATIVVLGYQIIDTNFSITPHCGSFDLNFSHTSSAVAETFWLQKYDPITNTWGHPSTGTIYVDGTVPTSVDSYVIANNFNNLNLVFLGKFRILKSYQSFDDGNIGTFKTCTEIIETFEFDGKIQFTGIEKINCDGNFMDVKLYAVGVPPLHYTIILKDNLPFFVDNGNSNVFTNLAPAIYTFKVEQSCGDSRNFVSDVAQLPSLAIANPVNDMFACDDSSNDGKEIFILSDQDAVVLGTQNPAMYTISYHLSLSDANANINPLPTNYLSGSDEIFCRLKYNNSAGCFDVVSFNLVVNPYLANPPRAISLCENQSVTITADSGFSSYIWSTGETTQTITVNQSGQYILDVIKNYPTGSCTGQFIYNVTEVSAPVIDHLNIVDWTSSENSIEVVLQNPSGNYLYSLDNTTFQTSNIFTNLLPGGYIVYVKDLFCGDDKANAFLLNYPKFFTPNGDGNNDYWNIKFSHVEPDMKTFIYDRYGKLITSFKPGSAGWDGTLNGQLLPSTDYWFVVIRQDGRNLKGHFAMKR